MFNSKMKKILAAGAAVLALSALSITAFAASAYKSPAEAVAALTGKTVESVVDQRQETGDTYCTIASEGGVLDEYKASVLQMKKDTLNARVAAGTLTQERADEIIAAIEKNMADCDGTCDGNGGAMMGRGFGAGNGNCAGNESGTCTGNGTGNGTCTGNGNTDGTCTGNGFGGGRGGQCGMRGQNGSCLTANNNG
ncbi:MAG TPA: DUF2680 domain-containing protein [Oscillospiraceae bacterium]|nr:DUF2680 domain-containing protein [Oscillospiraceae bacterium]HPS34346.1 DUF2680 domain-containing protein [Oscillospiraceae bacterium]